MAEHYPHFEERVRIALKVMLGAETETRVKIGMAKDGSGVGGTKCLFRLSRSHALI